MKSPVTRREAIERIAELEEIVAGAQAKEELLLDYIADICDIIYYQEPLRIQDRWLKVMTEKGLYTPDEPEDIVGLA